MNVKHKLGTLFFPLTFAYYELLFHLFVFKGMDADIVFPVLFGAIFGCVAAVLTTGFSRRINLCLSWILLSLDAFICCGQRVYFSVFKTFLAPTAIVKNAGAVTEFFGQVLYSIWLCSVSVLLFALPFGVLAVLLKKQIYGGTVSNQVTQQDESTSEAATELTNEAATELTNEAATEETTEAATEETNEAATEETTEAATEETNEAATEETTEAATEETTEAATEAATEETTEAMTEQEGELLAASVDKAAENGKIEQDESKRRRRGVRTPLIYFAVGIVLCGIVVGLFPLYDTENHSPRQLVLEDWIQEFGYQKLGVAVSVCKDIGDWLFQAEGNAEEDITYVPLPTVTPIMTSSPTPVVSLTPTAVPTKTTTPTETTAPTPSPTAAPTPSLTPTPIDTSPNILDIDFATLAETETNDIIKKMHLYFSQAEPTNKNEYTGMFEGYNLISICAEAFSPYVISEELTPTLYRMYHEGFQFTDYYEGVWFSSTSDGEYLMDTGLYPQQYRSMAKSAENLMYFCLGNQFRKLGYTTFAYHNHTYDYYSRDLSHPNMGYTYKGEGNGLAEQDTWPESDLIMMQETLPDYLNEENFHIYYMTVSGHKDYLFSNNRMSKKNRELVEGLDYSEPVLAYIACNLELEHALAYLVEELEAAGKLDKTVFVLTADHYPYGLTNEELNELAGEELDESFGIYKNALLIWNSAMEEPVVTDKPCSNVDVLPTVSNLFGLEYDSRLLMGRDILSDEPGMVFFNNWSFITELCTYSSRTGELIVKDGVELPSGYRKTITSILSSRFDMATKLLNENYYSYIPLLSGQ